MIRTLAIAAPLLLLVACGSANKAGDNSAAVADDGAVATGGGFKLEAGEWETTSELVSMEAPGMPPEIAAKAKAQKNVFKNCLTPEQAAKPASDAFMNREAMAKANCKAESFSMTGGRLQAATICTNEQLKQAGGSGEMRLTIDGQYTPTSYDTTVTTVTAGPPGAGELKVVAHTVGKRIGECKKS